VDRIVENDTSKAKCTVCKSTLNAKYCDSHDFTGVEQRFQYLWVLNFDAVLSMA